MTDAPSDIAEEDQSRAMLYALIGRLFYDGPDTAMLARIADGAADADTALGAAWQTLAAACLGADHVALQHEHQTLFIGVGKSPVTPYLSAYVSDSSSERHLLALRQQLAAWGLVRDAQLGEVEDHVSGVCDVMRYLIERGESLQTQEKFFNKYIYLQMICLCEKVAALESARFYRHAARFATAFLEVERTAFEMIDNDA
jgi:TorA maturation chaperone TorD